MRKNLAFQNLVLGSKSQYLFVYSIFKECLGKEGEGGGNGTNNEGAVPLVNISGMILCGAFNMDIFLRCGESRRGLQSILIRLSNGHKTKGRKEGRKEK